MDQNLVLKGDNRIGIRLIMGGNQISTGLPYKITNSWRVDSLVSRALTILPSSSPFILGPYPNLLDFHIFFPLPMIHFSTAFMSTSTSQASALDQPLKLATTSTTKFASESCVLYVVCT